MSKTQPARRGFEAVLQHYFIFRNDTRALQPLSELFKQLRSEDFLTFVEYLEKNKDIAQNLAHYLKSIFDNRSFNVSLSEANILSENGFFPEFRKRILNNILPSVENEQSVWYLIDYLTNRPAKDFSFLKNVPAAVFIRLLRALGLENFITDAFTRKEILLSANVLAWRAIGNALDSEVLNMVPEYKNFQNPFVALQDELDEVHKRYENDPDFVLTSRQEDYKQIKIYLGQAHSFVDQAFKNVQTKGISGKINLSLLKIRQQLVRIGEILDLLVIDSPEDVPLRSRQLVYNIISYKSHKNNILELFNDSTRLLSHLITNHTAQAGVHYIAASAKGYAGMFWKASGGGIIVGFLCLIKMLYGQAPGSPFHHAFLYSLNYAMGFVMIYLMSFTLATKQPAMTAATMAKVLSDGRNKGGNYSEFAHLIAQLFRTQFIAFVGNVLWSFPVALLLIYFADVLLGQNLAVASAGKLIHDLDPRESKPFLHAGIAGFYLFLSGIISGSVGNNATYYQVPLRIAKNPILNRLLGENTSQKIADFYQRNWAGILSNFWFGVMLGITGTVGKFLGLDIDIRHITFAAGNFALGLYGRDFQIDYSLLAICIGTIILIGFFNFIISFGLSMALALRSRKVSMGRAGDIFRSIFNYFLRRPLMFFFPIPSKIMDERVKKITAHDAE